MTTAVQHPETAPAPTPTATVATAHFCLPEIPERHPDDMTSYISLHRIGVSPALIHYLGNPDITIVGAERYIRQGMTYVPGGSRYPDLLVAFDTNPNAYDARNGYIVAQQGKPPDFILEVASRSSRHGDREEKKDYYERMQVAEYWLFDKTGQFYGFHLAGFRLVAGGYEAITITKADDGAEQGFSEALNLSLCWRGGELEMYDPEGNLIPTFATVLVQRDAAEARADTAEARAAAATAHADQEAARADDAEVRANASEARADAEAARAQELQAELDRLRNNG